MSDEGVLFVVEMPFSCCILLETNNARSGDIRLGIPSWSIVTVLDAVQMGSLHPRAPESYLDYASTAILYASDVNNGGWST